MIDHSSALSPVWSVLIPTYRPTELLRDTLLSALEALREAGVPAQLEVVDDASPDADVAALLASWGLGSIAVFRRAANGGLGECWNTCIARARGEWIHILHQDDLVKPEFYARLGRAAQSHPGAGMVFCRTEFLEPSGRRLADLEQPDEGPVQDWLRKISAGQRLQCPSVVIRRETYRRIGHFDVDLRYALDWVMWVRVAASSEVVYVPEPLAIYRIHAEAATSKIKAAGITTIDLAKGVERIGAVLAAARRTDFLQAAADYAIRASGFAAYEAELAHEPRTAASEVATSLRYLGRFMTFGQILERLKLYLRLRAKALG